jgi:trk system potassium uptake protein
MDVVILGAGRVGYYLAKQLISEGKKITLIEKDPAVAKQISNQLDCFVLNEEGNSIDTLKRAGVDQADLFVSVTDSDEMNLLSCGIVAGTFNKPVTIARVRNIDYSKTVEWEKPVFGIDHVLNPEIEAAAEIIHAVQHGALSNVMSFKNSSIQIRTMQIDSISPFAGKSLKQIRTSMETEFLVPFVYRNNEYLIPTGDTQVSAGDELYILASEKDFKTIYAITNRRMSDLKKIAIVGGGNVACYIADELLGTKRLSRKNETLFTKLLKRISKSVGRTIHFIERDYDRCKYLAERYPDAIVSHADISEEGFLEEGNIEGYNLLIATTGNQELNIITAMYAKSRGIDRVIALVNKINYQKMTRSMGVDVCVSMNNATVNSILKLVRKGDVRSLHTLASSSFEILELSVSASSAMAHKQIQKIRLPRECLILLVMRGGSNIIPYGELVLEPEDTIVLASNKNVIAKVETLLSGP